MIYTPPKYLIQTKSMKLNVLKPYTPFMILSILGHGYGSLGHALSSFVKSTHTHTHHFHEFFFTITMLASHVGYFISWMYLAYSKFFTSSATTNLFSSPPFASSRRRASLRVWATNNTPHLDLFETYMWVPR